MLMLSVSIPLALYYIGVVVSMRHHGAYWQNDVVLRIILGALLAGHLQTASEFIWSQIRS